MTGPPGGLCLQTCSTHEDCASVGNDAVCSPIPLAQDAAHKDVRVCVPACTTKPDSARPGACIVNGGFQLVGFACVPLEGPLPSTLLDGMNGACMPRCGSTACLCDEHLGLCVGTLAQGLPDGSEGCTPGASVLEAGGCQGACVARAVIADVGDGGDTPARCLHPCVQGQPQSCGWSGSGPADSLCAIVPKGAEAMSNGGLGFCANTCNCDTDCTKPAVCAPLGPSSALLASRRGVCVDPGTRYLGAASPDTSVAFAASSGLECITPDTIDVGACVYGARKACRVGDCLGVKECLSDLSGYGACTCAPPSTDAGVISDADAAPTPVVDAGFSVDAGVGTDASKPEQPAAPHTPAKTGCGCHVPSARSDARGGALLALLLGLWGCSRNRSIARRVRHRH